MMKLSPLCSSHEGSVGSRATERRGMLLLRFVQRGVTGLLLLHFLFLLARPCSDTCDQCQIFTPFRDSNCSYDADAFQGILSVASLDTRRRVLASRVLRGNTVISGHVVNVRESVISRYFSILFSSLLFSALAHFSSLLFFSFLFPSFFPSPFSLSLSLSLSLSPPPPFLSSFSEPERKLFSFVCERKEFNCVYYMDGRAILVRTSITNLAKRNDHRSIR